MHMKHMKLHVAGQYSSLSMLEAINASETVEERTPDLFKLLKNLLMGGQSQDKGILLLGNVLQASEIYIPHFCHPAAPQQQSIKPWVPSEAAGLSRRSVLAQYVLFLYGTLSCVRRSAEILL